MSITRTKSGRLDLTKAQPYEVVTVMLTDGSVVRFMNERMGDSHILYLDKSTMDEELLRRLDAEFHQEVSWAVRLYVSPTLDEVSEATQYILPIDRLNELDDYSPKVGEELRVLPHYGGGVWMLEHPLGIVAWVSI